MNLNAWKCAINKLKRFLQTMDLFISDICISNSDKRHGWLIRMGYTKEKLFSLLSNETWDKQTETLKVCRRKGCYERRG